ncbi:MAG TPA: ABC transporter permease [Thermoanaerobaculia bacterium]|nr:ABC transporter permease [Thermoanaerobaculia bacterium]
MSAQRQRPAPPEPSFVLKLAWRLTLDPQRRREARAELAEGWEPRRARDGVEAADRWHRRQVTELAVRAAIERLRRAIAVLLAAGRELRPSRMFANGGLLDLRTSCRGLLRTPGTSVAIVATLGLALGASLATFALVHAVLVEPLPYRQPERLTRIYHAIREFRWPLSVADYMAIEEEITAGNTSFAGVAATATRPATLVAGELVERVRIRQVTPSYFPLLGVEAARGRLFSLEEGRPESAALVVLSYGYWQRAFGGDENVIGRALRLNGETHTVIGVLSTAGPIEERYDLFTALRLEPPTRKGPFFLTLVGLLREDAEIETARTELVEINRRLFPVWQSTYQDADSTYGVEPLTETVVGSVKRPLELLLGAVLFVLLIAASNTANLLIARVHRRSAELDLRAALGASRGRLARLVLADSGLLAIAGAALGAGIAVGAIRGIRSAGPDLLPRASELGFGGPVVAVAVGLMLAALLLTGGLPMLQAVGGLRHRRRGATATGSAAGGSGLSGRSTASAGAQRTRRALVLVQFAVALPLLIGAGLLLNSFLRLQRVDPGFESERLLSASISLPDAFADHENAAFWHQLAGRTAAIPGVQGVGLAESRPPAESQQSNNFNLLDRPVPPGQTQPIATWLAATPDYFTTLGIPLLRGRPFDEGDVPDAPPVVLVDRRWAERYYPGENAIGRRFQAGGCDRPDCEVFTVVGIVGDVHYNGLQTQTGTLEGTIYTPHAQWPSQFRYLFVRTEGDPFATLPLVRATLRELDSEIPLADVASGSELIDAALAAPRGFLWLLGGFAIAATMLSLLGTYGVMVFFVQQQRREIGVRIALGGDPATTFRMVLARGLAPVLLGSAIGVAAALGLSGAIASSLYGVTARDPLTFAACVVLLVGAAVLSCLQPARRAAQVDPASILRQE